MSLDLYHIHCCCIADPIPLTSFCNALIFSFLTSLSLLKPLPHVSLPFSTLLFLHLAIYLFPISAVLPESSSFSLAAYCPPCSPPFFRPSLWLILASSASVSVGCILHPSTLLLSPLTLPLVFPNIAFPFTLFHPFPSLNQQSRTV